MNGRGKTDGLVQKGKAGHTNTVICLKCISLQTSIVHEQS